jgi:hypothetical protein
MVMSDEARRQAVRDAIARGEQALRLAEAAVPIGCYADAISRA